MTESTDNKRPPRARRRRGRSRSRNRGAPTGVENSESLPLYQRSTSHFQAADRRRGERYFDQGRVTMSLAGTRTLASVQGTEAEAYAVGIDWTRVEAERRLHVFCQCERFAGGTPCKHIWATLLDLAAKHPDCQPPGKNRIGLRKDRAARWPEFPPPTATPIEKKEQQPNRRPSRKRPPRRQQAASTSVWRTQLDTIQNAVSRRLPTKGASTSARKNRASTNEPLSFQLLLNTSASTKTAGAVLDVFGQRVTAAGKPGKLRRSSISLFDFSGFLAEENGEDEGPTLIAALKDEQPPSVGPPSKSKKKTKGRGRRGKRATTRRLNDEDDEFRRFLIPRSVYQQALPLLCKKGLLRQWDGRRLGDPKPLIWKVDEPWTFALHLEFAAANRMRLRGILERGDEQVPLSKSLLILPEIEDDYALLVFADTIERLHVQNFGDIPWITLLRAAGEIVFPEEELEDAVASLLELEGLPALEAPAELQLKKLDAPLRPLLVLEKEDTPDFMNPQLMADLFFLYGDVKVGVDDTRPAVVDWEKGLFVRRDMDAEDRALVRLLEAGLKPTGRGDGLELDPLELPGVAEPLLRDGWDLEVYGTTMRPPSPPSLRVESGLDWFELKGQVDFEGDKVEFSRILEAIERGERTVTLDDGSKGLLPEEWIETYDSLAQLAQDSSDEGLRFLPSQALLVDTLLSTMPAVDVDASFTELREKLRSFEAIEPIKEPRGFGGTLRNYQRLGLGWLMFLREFGLGGVLADDMGLGKTVQALALLRTNRTPKRTTGLPNLVVAPRSLIYNWLDEAATFTPTLKVIEYSGPDREKLHKKLAKQDIVVTTYGTLRRDIGYLATVEFDTIILDEAQAIKNPESQTAKAARLLVARNRLALTGTPIENHLGELGSIFEFLNPGLLGRLPALEVLAGGREASNNELALVARGIRPFILRRTKAEVLTDLPDKTEQVIQISLSPDQRALYDQLAAGYRDNLLDKVDKKGVGGSAMQVLEALLRLRQIACHPGLVDTSYEEKGSSKLETLFERISELLSEGHKVVIFSQFTKLLAYVRSHLDESETTYAYLDGKTRKRGEVVERFQTDEDCKIFLISLKAGGVGLNLTAANYVFLLDPWWNPAVEAQAIDRTHRIGQERPVFAYRLIAKDTVEEKMLELQQSKRQLADAILEGEGQSLRDLTADDLRMLLS